MPPLEPFANDTDFSVYSINRTIISVEILHKFCWAFPILIHNIVTCIPIARQQLGKHITEQAYARNNITSAAKQRTSEHASLTIEDVFSKWSV
jgi:hypothetical protein